jgi:hypothetical protein
VHCDDDDDDDGHHIQSREQSTHGKEHKRSFVYIWMFVSNRRSVEIKIADLSTDLRGFKRRPQTFCHLTEKKNKKIREEANAIYQHIEMEYAVLKIKFFYCKYRNQI